MRTDARPMVVDCNATSISTSYRHLCAKEHHTCLTGRQARQREAPAAHLPDLPAVVRPGSATIRHRKKLSALTSYLSIAIVRILLRSERPKEADSGQILVFGTDTPGQAATGMNQCHNPACGSTHAAQVGKTSCHRGLLSCGRGSLQPSSNGAAEVFTLAHNTMAASALADGA